MTKLHFNYKDVFRAVRLGFSAKKTWMAFLGLLVGFVGYSLLAYLAYLVAGTELQTVWNEYRLLPFAEPQFYPFPWYSWIIYAVGALFFICSMLITGAAISKVAYEQLKGDEFYESRAAFCFAFKQASAVLASPLLLLGFIALVVFLGLLTSLVGAIPYFGPLWLGIFAIPAFFAALFIVYLLIALLTNLLVGPSIVGATRNDTFDTVFEVFSCLNEQPARLPLYVVTVAVLSEFGMTLLAIAASLAGRVGYTILRVFPGERFETIIENAAYYFNVTLPVWLPEWLSQPFYWFADLINMPELYAMTERVPGNWAMDVSSLLFGVAFYVVVLIVIAFGCSIWFTGNTLAFAVLAKLKDDKNILDLPEEEDLLAPVVDVPGFKPGDSSPESAQTENPQS